MKSNFNNHFIEQFAQYMAETAKFQTFWGGQAQNNEFIQECQSRFQDYLKGTQLYQRTNIERDIPDVPVVWAMGAAKVYDYSLTTDPNAPIVFVVPSLINRAYILDLTEKLSFLRALAQGGVRPFLLDWGDFSEAEREFGLDEYINKYLMTALQHVRSYTGGNVAIMGYCMGGILATAAAQLQPDIKKLILLATPWDFHAGYEWLIPWIQASSLYLEQAIQSSAELPADLIQQMFTMVNPLGIIRKFRQLPNFADDLERMTEFANVEEWLNDFTPLAANVAKECLFGWYRDNDLVNGNWKIGGQVIDPSKLKVSSCIILPQTDKIVPTASSQALINKLSEPIIIEPETGHIGSIVGRSAKAQVIPGIIDFLQSSTFKGDKQ